jgi:type I restriction enzyme S subunit
VSRDWPIIALGDVLKQRKEFVVIDDLTNYKRPRVQLHAKGVVLRDVVAGALVKTKHQQVCRTGEFLVAEIDAKVGGFGLVPPELDGAIVSSHYFLFVPDEHVLDRHFLEWFIRTPAFHDQVEAQGSTNYAAIRPSDVLGYKMPLPPLAEQQRIVARIEEMAGRIEKAHLLRQQTEAEAQALTRALVRESLARIREEVTSLESWLDWQREGVQTGPFGAQLGSDDFVDTGIPVLTIGNVQYSGLVLDGFKRVTPEKSEALRRYQLEAGDILFARMGTVGRCCIVPDSAAGWLINYHIIRVAVDKARLDPRFLHWTIRCSPEVEEYLGKTIRGATRQGVNSSIVRGLPCRVPSLARQRTLVARFEGFGRVVEGLVASQREASRLLVNVMPAVLDRAFKGEL